MTSKEITNWKDLQNLIHNLSNSFFIKWRSNYPSEDKRINLDLIKFTPILESAPLWSQLKERGIDFTRMERFGNAYVYYFITKPITE